VSKQARESQKKAERIINNLKEKTGRIPLKTKPEKEFILIAKKNRK